MKNPFNINIAENKPMKSWDIALMVGGFQTKAEAESAAKVLAEFMAGDRGWASRAQ